MWISTGSSAESSPVAVMSFLLWRNLTVLQLIWLRRQNVSSVCCSSSKPLKSKDSPYSESMSTHTRASRMAVIATEWGVRHSRGGVYIDAELQKGICLKQKSQQALVTGMESAFKLKRL